ncbi:MAG TPA: cytochrome P450 [Streptosporangiaceae bacterium]
MATDARDWVVSTAEGIRAVLSDDRFAVPQAPGGAAAGTLAWLRSAACRFSNGPEHDRRRAVVTAELGRLDTATLTDAAWELTIAVLAGLAGPAQGGQLEVMGPVARRVPVFVLATQLGAADPGRAADAVQAIGGSYLTGAAADPAAADAATRVLLALLAQPAGGSAQPSGGSAQPGTDADIAVARATILLQSYDATAGLIGNALALLPDLPADTPTTDLLAQAVLHRPPVRAMRRVALAVAELGGEQVSGGDTVICDIDGAEDALTFGYGLRPCPAQPHALALAQGVIDAVRERCDIPAGQGDLEPVKPLRVPASLTVVLR